MKLPLRYYGHPDLRKKAWPVLEITQDIVQLSQDMIETMLAQRSRTHFGVGLAGPQVGRLLRIFIRVKEWVDAEGKYHYTEPEAVLNPEISAPSEEKEGMVEGCLSLPKVHVLVVRPKRIHLLYQNIKGERIEEDLEGFSARVVMHENDHLNGVLHIDRTSPHERKDVEPLLREIKSQYNP